MSQIMMLDPFYNICEDGVSHPPFGLHLTALCSSGFISIFFPFLLLSGILVPTLVWFWSPFKDPFTFDLPALRKSIRLLWVAGRQMWRQVGEGLQLPPLAITPGAENRCSVQRNQCLFWRSKKPGSAALPTSHSTPPAPRLSLPWKGYKIGATQAGGLCSKNASWHPPSCKGFWA